MTVPETRRLEREIHLRSMFPAMPAAAHARLVDLVEDVELGEGEVLFSAGEPADRVYFLISGNVVMEREGFSPWPFGALAVVGVIDAMLERPRVRGCRALAPCRLMAIRAADWFDMLEDNAQIARSAIRNFATQLHKRFRAGLTPPARNTRASDPPPPDFDIGASTYERILVLRRAPLLGRAGMQAVASLATIAEPKRLAQGELLFDQNSADGMLAIVARGVIELRDETGVRVIHGPGELVGGPAALCGALGAYSARALAESVLLRFHEQDFYDQAEEHARLTRGTLAYLVSELDRQLTADPTSLP